MKRKTIAIAAALCLLCASGCSQKKNNDSPEEAAVQTEVQTEKVSAYERTQIGESRTAAFIELTPYYYEPVALEGTSEISTEGKSTFLEVDVSALANDLGYEEGSWVPYLTIDYDIADTEGKTVASGALMVSSSKNGPTYGSNVSVPGEGTYSLSLSVHSPAENGFYLHRDSRTGVTGSFWDIPVTATWSSWEYTGVNN